MDDDVFICWLHIIDISKLELIGRSILLKLGKGNLLPKIHDDTSMENSKC